MGRPGQTTAEFDVMRARILREATQIVGKVGLAGLSMRVLGDGVGLTPGALYRYFPSKKDLLWAMWQEALAELQKSFKECSTSEDGLAAVRCMLNAYATFALLDLERFRTLFLENDQGELNILDRDPNALRPYLDLKDAVADAVARGQLQSRNPERLAQILWAAVHGALTLITTVPEVDFGDRPGFVFDTIDAVVAGLVAQEKQHA